MSAVNDLTGELQKAHFEIARLKAEVANMTAVHEAYHAEQDRLIAERAKYKRALEIIASYAEHDEAGLVCQQTAANALKGDA